MGLLDNSGDILLDCVLTDTGRERLAKGDGSFKVVKFALGDDEIDYSLYNSSHPSGSAYYDQEIMQTLVFEAFTNNASAMNSKLITNPRANLLYLPTLKINEFQTPRNPTDQLWIVAVDSDTYETEFPSVKTGVMAGVDKITNALQVDQGLDTAEIPPAYGIGDLIETQYIIRMDNRYGRVVSQSGVPANVSYIDDDNIATYFLNYGSDTQFIWRNTNQQTSAGKETIAGPRGTTLIFAIQSTLDLIQSDFLFTQTGTAKTYVNACYIIDTLVRVEGITTGSRIDIPVRFAKKQ